MCQVRLKSHAPENRRGIEQLLESHDEIMECYSMSGEWDYLLRIVVADIEEYERFLMRHVLNHASVARSHRTSHSRSSNIRPPCRCEALGTAQARRTGLAAGPPSVST